MIIRIIIVLLIFYFHKEIINFFYTPKFEKIKKKFVNLQNNLENNDINLVLNLLKKNNNSAYKYINKRLKIIIKIYKEIVKNDYVSKNQYEIIKYERKNIMNEIVSLNEKLNKKHILEVINNYIMVIINRILTIRKNIDINWFEEDNFIDGKVNVEAYDNKMNFNYDIY